MLVAGSFYPWAASAYLSNIKVAYSPLVFTTELATKILKLIRLVFK